MKVEEKQKDSKVEDIFSHGPNYSVFRVDESCSITWIMLSIARANGALGQLKLRMFYWLVQWNLHKVDMVLCILYMYIYIVTYLYDTEETRGLKRTVPADDPISISSESPEPPASRASAVVRPGRRQSLDSPGEEESVSLQQTAEVRAKQNPKNQRSAVA